MTALETCPFIKKNQDKNKTGLNSDTRDTKSKLNKKCVIDWCGLKSKSFLRKVIAVRILVGLARTVRIQIGNTGLGWCDRRPLEKITAFKFCLFGAAPSKESTFFRNKFDYYIATDYSTKHTLILFLFLFILVLNL